MRRMAHPLHQYVARLDDALAVAPGQDGGKKTSYLNILFFAKAMGNGDGVIGNKVGCVVAQYFFVQKFL